MSDTAVATANKLRRDLFLALGNQIFHASPDTAVTAPSATDLASLLVLCAALQLAFNSHVPNVIDPTSGVGIHGADSGHRCTLAAPTDLGAARAVLGDIETQLIQHADCGDGVHLTPQLITAPYFEMSGSVPEACAHANLLMVCLNSHFSAAMNSGVSA